MRIAIVDDLTAEFSKLTEILDSLAAEKCMTFDISCFQSGEEFLVAFEKENFDIIFMDIYMNGMTGVETAKEVCRLDSHCLLIFLTTSMEHMPEAFSCHAFEYIQKPVSRERVLQVMTDALNILPTETQYMEFTSNRQPVRLLYSDFAAAVTSEHYLIIADGRGKQYKTRQTFSKFMKALEQDSRFLQINKGILVNMDYIISIEENICTLKNGQLLPVRVRDSLKIREIWYQYGFEQIRTSQKREARK